MKRCIQFGTIMLVAGAGAAWSQTPVISALVNAASYEPTLATPGSIVTIFGSNLAMTTAVATSVPLPLQLGGASVTQGGVAAPLFYASPSQINFQVPSNNGGSFVVTSSAGSSSPYDPIHRNAERLVCRGNLYRRQQRMRPGRGIERRRQRIRVGEFDRQ
jgi:hypothetical protein